MNSGTTIVILPILLGIAAAALVHGIRQWLVRTRLGEYGYRPKALLTPNELDFYHRLRKALPARFVALPQVSMGALMDTQYRPGHPNYWEARQQFSARICDFVVCDAQTMAPQLVIELDDKMHDFAKDRKRDSLVAKAGYRTLRFWSRQKPSVETLKTKLAVALALN